ncbi:hypothetical protein BU649_02620 [Staphylococcus chromogenes]|uniref:hypothetical protein n=1 Tax=Staphylococcus chromogenes TaxID=46126 RepID=UPI000D1BA87C|nr:hypothetical protein [Staphylococcus chromogenes]PTG03783.1 hypothetical protein BU649_02620 [Staphylococcus chromogenes]PTG04510.1 hypothetical protein BU656_11510 [Staphylococcus chromogenes]PTG31607.1 hypothetical protein BU634_11570 [Staphylococcus chromogenes]PTG74734.1 hypothetical protein BU669_06465 [Staphylococcus chromogenes]PTG96187.1 hypothetical protein BU635_11650 [Staphylococcus chromogenes]
MSKLSIEELNEFLDDLFDRLKNEAKLYNSQSEFDIFLDRYQFQKMTIIKATSIMTMLKY